MTLGGNGRLTPADVNEAGGEPRRLVLDFPNVASKAPAQTTLDGPLVKRVRVALNTREPLLTRVVMEVAQGATYHVERAGTDGGDLAVVFEPPQSASTIMLTRPRAGAPPMMWNRISRSSRRSPMRRRSRRAKTLPDRFRR